MNSTSKTRFVAIASGRNFLYLRVRDAWEILDSTGRRSKAWTKFWPRTTRAKEGPHYSYAAKDALLEHPAVEFLSWGSDYDLLFKP